ncbi:MAG: stage III sporulation protein AB [Clostridia bacterium]|nr:stage III sporulation protein AB [Clostridia bacterium]
MGAIFALGTGLCCLFMGLSAGAALTDRQRRLEEWGRALERMENALESRCPLPEVLRRGAVPVLEAMARMLEREPLLSLQEAWRQTGENEPVLEALFEKLDGSSLPQGHLALKQAREQIVHQAHEAEAKAKKNQPLYRSLGLMGGLAVSLLLL